MEKARVWNEQELIELKQGNYCYPHELLGIHKLDEENQLLVRVLCPQAKKMTIESLSDKTKQYHIEGRAEDGFFEYIIKNEPESFMYQLHCEDEEGHKWSYIDPYQFDATITPDDLYLFGIGKDYELYRKMGAHFMTVNGIRGVRFLVWAPHAIRVSVVGKFNNWDGRRHSMRFIPSHGVWEIFIPGLEEGESYRYEIKTADEKVLYKADPYATYCEVRPKNASVVFDESRYKWKDKRWINAREKKELCKAPMSIYEVHIGSWRRREDGTQYSYKEIAEQLAVYVKEMGYTHVELMGILEHPFDGSWGYQVTGYFAPTSRYGTPDEFKQLVDILHQNGIGVILDWVPAHFPKDAFALEKFDGQALYEKADEKQANHPHWGTLIFDYDKPQVSLFLIASALSWLERYHIDGLRVDAVASMLYLDYGRDGDYVRNKFGGNENLEAIEFIKHLNEVAYERVPGITMIAEESTAWPKVSHPISVGGLGFGFKWNMGWMNDFLSYMKTPEEYRDQEHKKITFSLMYAFSENYIQVLSHDEVVHEKQCMLYKMPGTVDEKYSNLKTAYGFLFMHPGKKMLFMGNEFAVTKEWNEEVQLQWELLENPHHKGIQEFVKMLNKVYSKEKALWEISHGFENFEWIDCENASQKTLSFVRKGTKCTEDLVIVVNFSHTNWEKYRIGVPHSGIYKEILNSDDTLFGGEGKVNASEITAEMMPWQNRPQSMEINLPAFSICVFKAKKIVSPERLEKLRVAKVTAKKEKADKVNGKRDDKTAKKSISKTVNKTTNKVNNKASIKKATKKQDK